MSEYKLTEEQRVLRDQARRFAQNEIFPHAAELDEKEQWPEEILKKAHENGFMPLLIPETYGGPGLSLVDACLVVEELAAACMGVTTSILAVDLGLTPILVGGSEEQKKKYIAPFCEEYRIASFGLTEPGSGSDAAGMSTTAVKKGDKYIINGTKQFITNGSYADLITVFATLDKSKGPKGICGFVVEKGTPGLEIGAKEKKMGQRCSNTVTLNFEEMEVPAENLLGNEGEGFKIAMKTLDRTRPFIGISAVGMARAAMDHSIAYAKERKQFGQPIAAFQAIQFLIADMAIGTEASRLLTLQAAEMLDKELDATKYSSYSKAFSTDNAMRVATDAVQVFGGYGYSREYPVEKIMRDAKLMQVYEGTNQIQRMVIARELFKA